MKKESGVAPSYNNVIRLPMDANFFFERAVHSLERHHYDKALKYFRLAVEKEPDNPVNYCNLAGVLSEVGRFEESNEVLRYVLDHISPDLVECYFYMANNAANMDCFAEAEKYAVRYLQTDPEGEFSEEADELLQMLAMEMGRSPRSVEEEPYEEWMGEHDRARQLLESGQFTGARKLLEKLVAYYPEYMPARNNLALAYYYCGELDRALETVQQLLQEEPGNFHALCNLTVFYYHIQDEQALSALVDGLKKCLPLETEDRLKLATTMGIIKEHETAYTIFCSLLRTEMAGEAHLWHQAAAAAFNTSRFQEAERFWKQAERLDRHSGIPQFYLSQLSVWREMSDSRTRPVVGYQYDLPFEEQFRQLEQEPTLIPERLRHDPVIRASFFWALSHGDYDTKLQVIQALGYIGDADVERVLREFLLKKDEDDYLKRVTLFVLRHMNVEGPFSVTLNGQLVTVKSADLHDKLPVWHRSWQAVVDSVLKAMESDYDMIQKYDAEALWFEFLRKTYPNVPHIRKADGWAAALEYSIAKMYGVAITQQEVARKYHVSPATVGRHAREIETVCGVFHRMKAGITIPFFQT